MQKKVLRKNNNTHFFNHIEIETSHSLNLISFSCWLGSYYHQFNLFVLIINLLNLILHKIISKCIVSWIHALYDYHSTSMLTLACCRSKVRLGWMNVMTQSSCMSSEILFFFSFPNIILYFYWSLWLY